MTAGSHNIYTVIYIYIYIFNAIPSLSCIKIIKLMN